MLRSRMVLLETQAPDLFERVRSTVFRSWDKPTIVSDFVLRWALAHGQARVRKHSHLYISTGEGDLQTLDKTLEVLGALAGQLDFFCINDTTDDAHQHDPRLEKVRNALIALFPHPSRLEHPTAETSRLAVSNVTADQVMSTA